MNVASGEITLEFPYSIDSETLCALQAQIDYSEEVNKPIMT